MRVLLSSAPRTTNTIYLLVFQKSTTQMELCVLFSNSLKHQQAMSKCQPGNMFSCQYKEHRLRQAVIYKQLFHNHKQHSAFLLGVSSTNQFFHPRKQLQFTYNCNNGLVEHYQKLSGLGICKASPLSVHGTPVAQERLPTVVCWFACVQVEATEQGVVVGH